MDLFSIVGACLRRWYVTLPLLLVTGFVSYQAYLSVPPAYFSETSVVVLPNESELRLLEPEEEGAEETQAVPENPYSGQGGSRFAVAVLERNINSTAFKDGLALDPAVEQTFEAKASSDQPMIRIEATAPTEEQVYVLLDQVMARAAVVLDNFQADAGAAEPTRYRIAPAVPAGPVEDVTPSRFRYAGAFGVLGLGVTAALAVAVDALLYRRGQRRAEDGARDLEDAAAEPPADEERAEPVQAGESQSSDEGRAQTEPAAGAERSLEGVGATSHRP